MSAVVSFWKVGPLPPKPRKPLPSKSAKTAARDRRYSRERVVFLDERPICEARLTGCTWIATEVHHRAGRSPSVFFRQECWLPSCHGCHQQITSNPAMAYERGLSVHRIGVEVGA